MTKTEVMKELFKRNLNEFNQTLNLELKIKFKDGKFSILNKNKEIFEDEILNYGLDFGSQKRFIMKIVFKLPEDIGIRMAMEHEYNMVEVDCLYEVCKVVGNKDYMFPRCFVKVDKKKLKNCDGEENYKDCLRKIFEKIKSKLDGNKVEVFYDNDFSGNGMFYINFVIYKKSMRISYVDTEETTISDKDFKKDKIDLYYSDVKNCKEEAAKAVEYIKELLHS